MFNHLVVLSGILFGSFRSFLFTTFLDFLGPRDLYFLIFKLSRSFQAFLILFPFFTFLGLFDRFLFSTFFRSF